MDFYLDRLHNPSTRITRSYTDHGGCRSVHTNSALYRCKLRRDHRRCSRYISKRGLETARSTYGHYFGYGRQVFGGISGVVMQVAGHKTKDVHCKTPPDRWTDGKNQRDAGGVPTQLRQLRPERLVSATTTSRTCVQ